MQKKILIVEDDVEVQRSISTLLENFGYKVLQSLTAEIALSIVDEELDNLGLIITDINMPGMKGDEFITKIAGIKDDLPIIVFSGIADEVQHLLDEIKSVKAVFDKNVDYSGFKKAIIEHYAG